MRFNSCLAFVCSGALVLASCGDSDSSKKKKTGGFQLTDEGKLPETAAGTGCIQGFLFNALTGERMTVGVGERSPGLYAQVQSARYFAKPVGDQREPLLRGEYYICNVPLDETVPVVGIVNGYVPTEGMVRIESKMAYKGVGEKGIELTDKKRPMAVMNVAMYPYAAENEQPAQVMITNLGTPLANAVVRMQLVAVPKVEGISTPDLKRNPVIVADTNARGVATFPAGQLVRGGTYKVSAEMKNSESLLRPAAVDFIYGKNDVANVSQRDGFNAFIELSAMRSQLELVSSNVQVSELNPSGAAIYLFNRDIELMPGTEDSLSASLTGSVYARLKADIPGNGLSESVSYQIEGNRLVVSPNFERAPDSRIESKLKIRFNKMVVRAKGLGNSVSREIPASEITMFDQQPVIRVAKIDKVESRIADGIRVGDAYSVKATVRDQFGYPLTGAAVSCVVSDANTVRAMTNDDGVATCDLKVGQTPGARTIRVTVESTNEAKVIQFSALAGLPAKLNIDVGASQTGIVGMPLAQPIVVRVTDAYGNALANVGVSFQPSVAEHGTVAQAMVLTDAEGKSTTTCTLGSFVGTQKLVVKVDGVGSTDISATAQKPAPTPTPAPTRTPAPAVAHQ